MNIIDITIIVILVIGIFMGYRRGIISTVINLAGYVLAFIGVKMYSDDLAIMMEKNPKISAAVNEYVIKNLPKFDFSGASVNATNIQGQGVDVSGSQLWDIADKFPFLKKPLETNVLSKFNNVSDVFSHYIYLIISAIIIFIGIRIAAAIISFIISKMVENSILLNGANKLLGMGLGGVASILLIVIGLNIAVPMAYMSKNENIRNSVDQSKIVQFVTKEGYRLNLYSTNNEQSTMSN